MFIFMARNHGNDLFYFFNNIYFQEAFSQSDFQKGPELNKQICKKGMMHILYITMRNI